MKIFRGAEKRLQMRLTQDGVGVNIAGSTFAMYVSDWHGQNLASYTSGTGEFTIDDDADGRFSLVLTDAQTLALAPAQKSRLTMWWQPVSGGPKVLWKDILTVEDTDRAPPP